MRRPCNNCPFRVDAPVGYWDNQHFIDIWKSCQDDGMHMMLCHKATSLPEEERSSLPCQGWARVVGFDSIGVRMAVIQGRIALEEVKDHDGPELYESFEAMLEANGIEPPQRNRHYHGDE